MSFVNTEPEHEVRKHFVTSHRTDQWTVTQTFSLSILISQFVTYFINLLVTSHQEGGANMIDNTTRAINQGGCDVDLQVTLGKLCL